MARAWQTVLWAALVATCLKLLLVPSYRSTDFEVHRHWLALTRCLPISQWYLDETSEWTLDYPPFFAWFERALAVPAAWADPQMVDLRGGLNHASPATILFQRATVMVSDLVLYYATWRVCRRMEEGKRGLVVAAVLLHPGLLMVDHIHFQYNGFLLGLLLLSLSLLQEGRDWLGGVVFAALLCFKHLFAVAAPLYFVYLLRHFCWGPRFLPRLLLLGASVLGVGLLAFGPFIYLGQLGQLLARLFPFGRGLCHAYWAPNLWALYNAADKLLGRGLRGAGAHRAALTGGLVGDAAPYAVLPQITPGLSLALVLLSQLPCLLRVWRAPIRAEVVRWAAHAYMGGFMLGWHVHEKAALHFVVPLALLVGDSWQDAEDFLFVSTVATYSLFPLLFDPKEYPIKVLLLLVYTLALSNASSASFKHKRSEGQEEANGSSMEENSARKCDGISLSRVEDECLPGESSGESSNDIREEQRGPYDESSEEKMGSKPDSAENGEQVDGGTRGGSFGHWSWIRPGRRLYLWGLVWLEIYVQIVHPTVFRERLPFLPLLLISVYSALGMTYMWLTQLVRIICEPAGIKAKDD